MLRILSCSLIGGSLSLISFVVGGWIESASAQITVDDTVGSRVGNCGDRCQVVEGGLQRGEALFHSFSEFGIGQGQTVRFIDPGVRNILTRVTGDQQSRMNGLLQVTQGNANFFLLNPNGILFGENSSLDVGGSFVATTANAIQLANGDRFFADPDAPLPNQLLRVDPSSFLFNQLSPAPIINRSRFQENDQPIPTGLDVPPGRSFLLVGGAVNLAGGRLSAPGGRIELGGLAESGSVGLVEQGRSLRLRFPANSKRAEVSITDGALVNASTFTTREGNAGTVAITARDIELSGGGFVETSSFGEGQSGAIRIQSSGTFSISGLGSGLFNRVRSPVATDVDDGEIRIHAANLQLTDKGTIDSSTFSVGNAGNIFITVDDRAVLNTGSVITSFVGENGVGEGGDIQVRGRSLVLLGGSQIQASVTNLNNRGEQGSLNNGGRGPGGNVFVAFDEIRIAGVETQDDGSEFRSGIRSTSDPETQGEGGEIFIRSDRLILTNRGNISATTSNDSDGGSIDIHSNRLRIANEGTIDTDVTDVGSDGNAGNITITATQFSISHAGRIDSFTIGNGDAGNISIRATRLNVTSEGSIDSSVSVADAQGQGGEITIVGDRLRLDTQGTISASTSSDSPGGSIVIQGDRLEIMNEGRIETTSRRSGSGNAGNIDIQDATRLVVTGEGSQLSVNAEGAGNGGQLRIGAAEIFLDDGATLNAATDSGTGGSIRLDVGSLLIMNRDSRISTSSGTSRADRGNGGNINIDSNFVIGVPNSNSDIAANSFGGQGGEINITARSLFGLEFRTLEELQTLLGTTELDQNSPQELQSNDITAISLVDPQLSGTVVVELTGVDPSRGVIVLPTNFVPEQSFAQACSSNSDSTADEGSVFFITGRGGLPGSPESLQSAPNPTPWVTRRDVPDNNSARSDRTESASSTPIQPEADQPEASSFPPMTEARGWVRLEDGSIRLTTEETFVAEGRSPFSHAVCDRLS